MEGVEDIPPEPVLSAGFALGMGSFPDLHDWLSQRNFDIDIVGASASMPHARLCDGRERRRALVDPLHARGFAQWLRWRATPCVLARWATDLPAHPQPRTLPATHEPTLKAGE